MDWSIIVFMTPLIFMFTVCGIQLRRGKWLMLIAGYNTTSKKERANINGEALGKLVGAILIICSFSMLILALFPTPIVIVLFFITVMTLSIGSLIYVNTSDKYTLK